MKVNAFDIFIKEIHIVQHIVNGVDLHNVFQIRIEIDINLVLITQPHDLQPPLGRHIIHKHRIRLLDMTFDHVVAAAVIHHRLDLILLLKPANGVGNHIQTLLGGGDHTAALRFMNQKEKGIAPVDKNNNDQKLEEKRDEEKLHAPQLKFMHVGIGPHDHYLKIGDDIGTDDRQGHRIDDGLALPAAHIISAVDRQKKQPHHNKGKDCDTHGPGQPAQTNVLLALHQDKGRQKGKVKRKLDHKPQGRFEFMQMFMQTLFH